MLRVQNVTPLLPPMGVQVGPKSFLTPVLLMCRTVFLNRRAATRTGPWHQLYLAARDSLGINN